jgi:hypothetical protein
MGDRHKVRVSLALAGAGSLGTFLSSAARQTLLRIIAHNRAVDEEAADDDLRYLSTDWGTITVDSISGTSAGAITAMQVVKALFEPGYLGAGRVNDAPGTLSGDWVHGGEIGKLVVEGNTPMESGPVHSPGWTLLSGARLYDLIVEMLTREVAPSTLTSPMDPSHVIGLAVTLTDLMGYHEPAEFEAERVRGHADFGLSDARSSVLYRGREAEVRDLGSRGHAEVRKVFVGDDESELSALDRFLNNTRRRRRASRREWNDTTARELAAIATASAALPMAVGPLAVADRDTQGETIMRLYMDGGVLNNKPAAPAMRLGRWHDAYRLARAFEKNDGTLTPEHVAEVLDYERVCIFIDAFPERSFDSWRSRHPDMMTRAWHAVLGVQNDDDERARRLAATMATPGGGLGAFFESIMTALRAQNMREIAKINARLRRREDLIDDWLSDTSADESELVIDSIDLAFAYAAVVERPLARTTDPRVVARVTRRLVDVDRVSNLDGRRAVTMVPIFAPRGLREVFAGAALYALGGLLGFDARKWDASVGERVATTVLDAVAGRPAPRNTPPLPMAPNSTRPDDTSVVVQRIRVAGKAMIDGTKSTSSVIRFFARLPLELDPIITMGRDRLNRIVRGDGE